MCSNRFCHPLTSFGVPVFTYITQGSGLRVSRRSLATPSQAAAKLLHPGLLSPALPGSKFRGRTDRKLIDKSRFGELKLLPGICRAI